MTEVKILDCTLRDGGFYNNWDFDLEQSKKFVLALNQAGVDIIELGYKSVQKGGYYGLFKYSNEKLLDFVKEYNQSEYAFMIDAKEFVRDQSSVAKDKLDEVVEDQQDSIFQWVRIAIRAIHAPLAADFIQYFKDKGYSICLNLMGGSMVSNESLVEVLKLLDGTPLDYFYIADSYGAFYPSDITERLQLIKKHYKGKLGVHLHDNQGLAYANALAALDEGVDIVDATVMGMGRGAGNLVLEQFLLGFREKYNATHLHPEALLDAINDFIKPLKDHYQWGFSYMYMLSGLNNIHQSYCQSLNQQKRFTYTQLLGILSKIPKNKRTKFSEAVMDESIEEILFNEQNEIATGNEIPVYKRAANSKKAALIVAGGGNIAHYKSVLDRFAKEDHVQLVECNYTGLFAGQSEHIMVVLNKFKLESYLQEYSDLPLIVTGESHFPKKGQNTRAVYHMPYSLGEFDIKEEKVSIPDYDAGMYAIAFAINNGAQHIYLSGFEGFADETRNQDMNAFFKSLQAFCEKNNIEVKAVTPTQYTHLEQSSIYAIL